jgi:hypothetical protein
MIFRTLTILGVLFLSGCRENIAKKETEKTEESTSYLNAFAKAHGYEHWKSAKEIHFTFNVDRDSSHFERSWIWETGPNRVTQISGTDTVQYIRNQMDSTLIAVDAAFINDKFWLLAPYQWVWDQKSFSDTLAKDVSAPISGKMMDKLTITYGNQGGYTPGDAYDFYIGKDSLIAEWVFRKGNQAEPSLATTWEDYITIQGLKIGSMRKNAEGSFRLYFTNISVH